MKRRWCVICCITVIVVFIWGAYDFAHSCKIERLLDKAELSEVNTYKELWYSFFDMGLGYTDGYEVLILQVPSSENDTIANAMSSDSLLQQSKYTLDQVLSFVPRSCHPNVLRDIPSEIYEIEFSAWHIHSSPDEHIFYAFSDSTGVLLIYRVHSFGTN